MFFCIICAKSKKHLIKELREKRTHWLGRHNKYYERATEMELVRYSTTPPAPPSDSEMLYIRISDTSQWHVDEINDSLFKLTGKSYRGPM
jgi:hypothetical protein